MLSKRIFPSKIPNGMMTFLCILLVSAIFIVAVFGSRCTREKFTTEETKPTSAEAASASDKDIKIPAKPTSTSTSASETVPATTATPATPPKPVTPTKPESNTVAAKTATPAAPAKPATTAATTTTSALSSKETDLFQDIVDNKLSAEQITKMIKEGFITEKLVDKFMDTLKSNEPSSKVVEPFSNYAEYASF